MKAWNDLFKYMRGYLKQHLPQQLTYHHWGHTVHVLNTAEIIAKAEGIAEEDILLIKTGALFHDAGYVFGPGDHEEKSMEMALGVLPNYGYKPVEIQRVTGMIRATMMPQRPQNKAEQVLADADLEYLGTEYYEEMAASLYQEFRYYQPRINPSVWNSMQVDFFTKHRYHTEFCQLYKEPVKQQNLQKLLSRIHSSHRYSSS